MEPSKTIDRVGLYRQLWSEPTTRVATKYGISDVGLAKLCRKHDIPRPPRGYWAQLQHGQKPPQAPLPKPNHNPTLEIMDRSSTAEFSGRLSPEIDIGLIEIHVAESLRGCHELVSRANEEIQGARTDADGILLANERQALDVRTSKACARRALLIFDALLKECSRREYPVAPGPTVTILRHAIRLGIHETVDVRREPAEDADLSKPYEFGHSRFKSTRTPSGRLVIAMTEGRGYWASGARCSWRDTDKRRLEDCLDKVLIGLIETAETARQHAEQEQRRAEAARQAAERRAEAERQRAERRKLYKAEKARVDELLKQAENLHRSQQIRELIAAVRSQQEVVGPIQAESDVARWIDWATQQADRFDPLRPSPPSILDEQLEEDLQPPTPAWGSVNQQTQRSYWEQRNWWNRDR